MPGEDGGLAASTEVSTEVSTEASMGLAAHGSPSGSGRSGDPTGDRMPIPMATPMPTRQSSSRHPPRCLSHLLHRPLGITVTIRRATIRMSNSAQGDGDRWRPRRNRQRLLTPRWKVSGSETLDFWRQSSHDKQHLENLRRNAQHIAPLYRLLVSLSVNNSASN